MKAVMSFLGQQENDRLSARLLPIATDLSSLSNPSDRKEFFIGISLAILSSVFIGSSFILKKKGLIKQTHTTSHGRYRAGQLYCTSSLRTVRSFG